MQNRLKSLVTGAAVAAALTLPAEAWSDNGWQTWPTKTFDVKSVRLDSVVGTLRIDVKDSGPVTMTASGAPERLSGLKVRTNGSELRISGGDVESVWDWKNWFNFSYHDNEGKLNITLVVPKGEELRVDDLVGNATIGDTEGPLRFEAAVSNATIGRVGPA